MLNLNLPESQRTRWALGEKSPHYFIVYSMITVISWNCDCNCSTFALHCICVLQAHVHSEGSFLYSVTWNRVPLAQFQCKNEKSCLNSKKYINLGPLHSWDLLTWASISITLIVSIYKPFSEFGNHANSNALLQFMVFNNVLWLQKAIEKVTSTSTSEGKFWISFSWEIPAFEHRMKIQNIKMFGFWPQNKNTKNSG